MVDVRLLIINNHFGSPASRVAAPLIIDGHFPGISSHQRPEALGGAWRSIYFNMKCKYVEALCMHVHAHALPQANKSVS